MSKGRRPGVGSGRGSGRRPPDGPPPPEGDEPSELLDGIDAALRSGEPLGILAHASALAASLDERRHPLAPEPETELPPAADLLAMFVESGRPELSVMAFVVAHFRADEVARVRVTRAVDTTTLPDWVAAIGSVSVQRAVQTVDVLHDGANVVLGFRVGGYDLTAVTFVDLNLGGAVKDGFLVDLPLEEFLLSYRDLGAPAEIAVSELDLAEARAWLEDGLIVGDTLWPPFESDSWPHMRPLVEWLLRHCPEGGAGLARPSLTERGRARVLDDFQSSAYSEGFRDAGGSELVELLLRFGTDHGYGDPLLLSPTKIEILLEDWAPRVVVTDLDVLSRLPALLMAFVPWAHAQRGVPVSETASTLLAVGRWTPTFLDALVGDDAYFRTQPYGHALMPDADQVGGPAVLAALDDLPLPEEGLDLTDVPADVHDRVRSVATLADGCCEALFDPEHRTATRRLLHDVAVGDPQIFRRRSRDETAAAALCLMVSRANDGARNRQATAKALLAHFGLTSAVTQRAEVMRRAVDGPPPYSRSDFGHTRYLTAEYRRYLMERRDRATGEPDPR